MRRILLLGGLIVLTACGGGGGTPDDGGGAAYVTADPRGISLASAGGAAPGGEGGGGGGALPVGGSDPTSGGGLADPAQGISEDLAREIVEADLYRVAGDLLHLVNAHRGLTVVDLSTMTVLGRLALGGVPQEMFLLPGRAIVLLTTADGTSAVVDVSVADPVAPTESARFALTGSYRTSRLVGSVLCTVTDREIRSFLVGATVTPVDTRTLPEGTTWAFATDRFVAVASPGLLLGTRLSLVDVSSPTGALALRGLIEVPGWMSDERKLHAAGDVLRAITFDFLAGVSRLTTIDVSNLWLPRVLGSLELAPGEGLFGTRFTDDAAYIVTFEQIDPLWVVDLSDPSNPRIAGSLEVPGVSLQMEVVGDRLVAVGTDFTTGPATIVSLFDVSNPAAPALLDREDLGWGSSAAFTDAKALGVFPAQGLVLVPFGGETDRLVVLDLGAGGLTVRGSVATSGPTLRGFPHARGIVAVSTEEVVLADTATLAVLGRATVAEDVVDAARLPDGRLVELVRRGRTGDLGGVALDLAPERCWPHGATVAVTGWDDQGRAAYVVDFRVVPPAVSARFDLGGGLWWSDPAGGIARPDAWIGSAPVDALLTPAGRLVVSRATFDAWFPMPFPVPGGGGGGDGVPVPLDTTSSPPSEPLGPTGGFVVLDVPGMRLEVPVDVPGVLTGFAADGETLYATWGTFSHADEMGRPWMRHDVLRVDLATRATSPAANIPGFVVAARDGLVFTTEETWGNGWAFGCDVVALRVGAAGEVEVLDRLALPAGASDVVAGGATLAFSVTEYPMPPGLPEIPIPGGTGGDSPFPFPIPGTEGIPGIGSLPIGNLPGLDGLLPDGTYGTPGDAWMPHSTVGTVRLGVPLALGPTIDGGTEFLQVLLPETGSLLLARNGLLLQRHDVSGATAVLVFSKPLDGPVVNLRPDAPGTYLVALGYAGLTTAP